MHVTEFTPNQIKITVFSFSDTIKNIDSFSTVQIDKNTNFYQETFQPFCNFKDLKSFDYPISHATFRINHNSRLSK